MCVGYVDIFKYFSFFFHFVDCKKHLAVMATEPPTDPETQKLMQLNLL